MSDAELPLRQAVRGLMIDHRDRVLMAKTDLSFTDWIGWALPGGGIEAGEDPETALRRELLEETGLANPFIGPVVCYRTYTGPSAPPGYRGQHSTIHLVPCRGFTPTPAMSEADLRAEGIVGMQWFSVDELRALHDPGMTSWVPDLVARVLRFGGTIEPLVIEVGG